MSDKRFDNILKSKLDGHEVNHQDYHWEKMQQILGSNTPDLSIPIEDKFDQLLKGKLEEHTVVYKESSWLNLQNTLERSTSDTEVDHEVRSRLTNHTVAFVESHWQILKAKLELEKELRTKIFWTKASEVAIIALLIFSYMHIGPYRKSSENTQDKKQTKQEKVAPYHAPIAIALETKSKNEVIDQQIMTQIDHTTSVSTTSVDLKENSSISLPKANSGFTYNPSQITTDQIPLKETKLLINDWPNGLILESEFHEGFNNAALNEIQQPVNHNVASNNHGTFAGINNKETNPNKAAAAAFSNAESLLIAYHNHLSPLDNRDSEILAIPSMIKLPAKSEKWIGISTGAELNIVKTPIDIDFIKEPRDFGALSVTNGINYGVSKGKNEFFTGLYYSVKVYDPNIKEKIEVNKSYYVRDHVQEEFKILHLPFQYRRHLGELDKLHVYLAGGLAVNGVMYAEYTYDDQLQRGDPRPDYALDQKARYRQSDFHKGLLDSGHFKHNLYVTAEVGIGIEKRINKMKIFFDAMYKNNLLSTKLGPRDVKLNSISLNIGTRYKI